MLFLSAGSHQNFKAIVLKSHPISGISVGLCRLDLLTRLKKMMMEAPRGIIFRLVYSPLAVKLGRFS